jgi:hypothetical protein
MSHASGPTRARQKPRSCWPGSRPDEKGYKWRGKCKDKTSYEAINSRKKLQVESNCRSDSHETYPEQRLPEAGALDGRLSASHTTGQHKIV